MFKDTLLALSTFPDATPKHAIAHAVGLAAAMGAGISAAVQVLDVSRALPRRSFGEWLFDIPELVERSVRVSAANAVQVAAEFETAAVAAGVFQQCLTVPVSVYPQPDRITHMARVRDLTFLPVPDLIGLDELFVESIIFASGRPVILLPAAASVPTQKPATLDTIVVAWDFSRAAARVLADAMPLLRVARSVRFVTVAGEKALDDRASLAELERHVLQHRADAAFDTVDAQGKPIGEVLTGYALRHDADLLVMGAFGHSRLREFVLGGATRSIVAAPPLPVFMAH